MNNDDGYGNEDYDREEQDSVVKDLETMNNPG